MAFSGCAEHSACQHSIFGTASKIDKGTTRSGRKAHSRVPRQARRRNTHQAMNQILFTVTVLMWPILASGQLVVTVSPPKVGGQKAVVGLALRNDFVAKVESVRAAVFLLDEHGKMVGQSTRWIIGGSQDKPHLAAGATNNFNFVVAIDKPFLTTNLTANVTISRVVMKAASSRT